MKTRTLIRIGNRPRHSRLATKKRGECATKQTLGIPIGSLFAGISLIIFSGEAYGQAVSLGEAGNFSIVSSQGITNAGPSIVNGNVALSPITTLAGFGPGQGSITGTIHYNDTTAMLAQNNALTAYNTLVGMTYLPANNLTGVDLGGRTLTPGIYHFNSSVGLTGNLILDTLGNPNAVFVFQIGSTLTTAVGSSVTVIGAGAATPNIFWQVGSSATFKTGTAFSGSILANQSISFGTASSLNNGRAMALYGAVTMLGNTVTAPVTVLAAPGRYWNGTTSNLWSSINWSSSVAGVDHVVLGTDVDVVFSVNPGPQNQNTLLDTDVTISSLSVNDPVPVSIGGDHTLTLSATGLVTGININAAAGLTTISSKLELGYLSQIVSVNNADGLLISGAISGNNGLTKTGTGVLTLTGTETYTGATIVDQGILQLGNGLTTGTSIPASNSIAVSAAGTLALNLADGETLRNSVVNNGQIRWISQGINSQAPNSIFSGSGSMVVSAQNGTAVILGKNIYTGTTLIDRGILQLGDGIITGSSIAASGSIRVTPQGTLALNLADGETFRNSVVNNGQIRWISQGINSQSINSIFSGSGSMVVSAQNGTAVILGKNIYTGTTLIDKGILQLGDGIITGSSIAASGSIRVATQGTLALNLADGETLRNSVVNNGEIQWISRGINSQASNSIFSGTGRMVMNATGGTAVILGENTYTGATRVYRGTLQLGDGTVTNTSIANTSSILVTPKGTLTIDLADLELFPNSVVNNGQIKWISQGTNLQAADSVFSGTGSMVVSGSGGTAVILGNNTYTGTTLIARGTLQLGNGIAADTSIAASGSTRVASEGTLAINLADDETFRNSVINKGEIRWISQGTNSQASRSIISGSGNLVVSAPGGTAVILGDNTYTGTTLITRGILQLGNGVITDSSIASSDSIRVASRGTLALNLADGETFRDSVFNNGQVRWISEGINSQAPNSVFSGNGSMVVSAPTGTALILGNNTYTGATRINRGTLQLGDGINKGASISASAPIRIAPKGTLALNLADETTFRNSVLNNGQIRWISPVSNTQAANSVFSGSGNMTVSSPGTTVLLGNNTFGGGTTINSTGEVLVGNLRSNRSSPFGSGTLHIRNGFIDTVDSQLLQIETGGYQQSGGEISMHLKGTNSGDYTRFLVAGTADLSGGSVFAYDQSGDYVPHGGDRQNIIRATGGLMGEFGSNTPKSNFHNKTFDVNFTYHKGGTLLYPTITYRPKNADITWVQDSFRSVRGLTPNQNAVGGGLDGFVDTDAGHNSNLIDFLNGQNTQTLPDMYDLIAPDDLTAIFQMGFTAAEIQYANIERHLERVRSGAVPATQYTRSTRDSKGGLTEETIMTPGSNEWNVFIESTGGSVTVDDSSFVNGYDFDTMGVTVGGDLRLSDCLSIGIMGLYGKSDANLFRNGSIDAESYKGAFYATAFKDGFHVDALLGGGTSSYDTRRASLFGFAEGEADGWELNSMINTGYDFHSGNWTFSPTASVGYTRVTVESFSETGSLSPLSYPTQSQNSLRSELGAKLGYNLVLNGMTITPQVRVAWQHEFMDSTQAMESRFIGGSSPTFSVDGPEIDRNRAVLSAGISAQITPTVCIYGFYDGHLGSSDYQSNQVSAGIRIDF